MQHSLHDQHLAGCVNCLPAYAGLLVMHAHAADPLQAYGELFRSAPLPPLMRQGIMEPNILKHYLLLHDDAAGLPGGFAR